MIFVVEDGAGRPIQLRTSNTVAAYASRERAETAARTLNGTVREYSIAGIPVAEGSVAETLSRGIDDLHKQLAEERRQHELLRATVAAVIKDHGAHSADELGSIVRRLAAEARAWRRVADLARKLEGGEP